MSKGKRYKQFKIKDMYYRLLDTQTGCYMATGYNVKSLKDLVNDYIDYKVNGDCDDEDKVVFESMSIDSVISFIEFDGFIIERSKVKFESLEDK